jgi:hypothetical protein
MTGSTADPAGFKPCRESLATTLARTCGIAVILASVICLLRLHHVPTSSAQWRGWLAWVVFIGWISLGGHWVEVIYLNVLRPRLANWPAAALVLLRLALWMIGGAILFTGAMVSLRLVMAGELPGRSKVISAFLRGGPIFVAIELVVHVFMMLAGRPNCWNFRG